MYVSEQYLKVKPEWLEELWFGDKGLESPVRRGRVSVFLEDVRQEMPKAHLELFHSGSVCVTVEAFGILACLPT